MWAFCFPSLDWFINGPSVVRQVRIGSTDYPVNSASRLVVAAPDGHSLTTSIIRKRCTLNFSLLLGSQICTIATSADLYRLPVRSCLRVREEKHSFASQLGTLASQSCASACTSRFSDFVEMRFHHIKQSCPPYPLACALNT